MTTLHPYLNFNGNCEEAFNFYKSVFGGDFAMVMRFADVPAEHQGDPAEAKKIMHIALPVGNSSMLMGSDVPAAYGSVKNGSNFYISITVDSKEEADRQFNALSAGGKVHMPMDNTFWGSYFGMTADKYGVLWMMSFDKKQQQ